VATGNKPVMALVGIVMGSDTDFPVMSEAGKTLGKFGIAYEMEVLSAHRTPARAHEYATTALKRGLKVLIAAAGAAAHLAGVMAANTLNGLDALLATVQMPGGIPVATMAIDKAGAVNAAIFAAQILGLSDAEIARKLVVHKEELVKSVAEKNVRLQKQISEIK
jgi:5-(carboxyamino)imidazole ribonucleotide mutase